MRELDLTEMEQIEGSGCNDVLGVGAALITIGLLDPGIIVFANGAVLMFRTASYCF